MSAGIRAGASNDGYLQVNGVDVMGFGPGAPGNGMLINVRYITANTTYIETPGTKSIEIEGVGGGGAGGGVPVAGGVLSSAGSGGGSGTYGRKRMTSGFSGLAVVVGAAGVPVNGGAGGAGGTSSFGTFSLPGGPGGALGGPNANGASTFPTANAGLAINADFSITGQGGDGGFNLSATSAFSGRGGSNPLGTGAKPSVTAGISVNPGNPASGFGSGGSGATGSQNGATQIGGTAGPGIWIVREFA